MPELPTVEDALALGLTEDEYRLVCERHGGPPNVVELAMYSLLWSEHCAYKHSKRLLRTLPTDGPHVVMGPGENAGAVDIGGGLVCAFKVESHNHPSAVEPFQGAATGVGGILRDIFAVGARPIAVLDSLRFGDPFDPDASAAVRTRYLLNGVVSGVGHYGNSVGVPTVGGEVYFEGPYGQSCLVNVMALGVAPREGLLGSAAAGPGNVVVLFGAATGRDGIGGASVLASAELGGDGDSKRPTVQVGDPFEGSKLLECSLALLEARLLVSLQDLGAAGLTSSAAEMASKGAVGLDIDIAEIPLREADMEPFEIMVSESQERMLCVCAPANASAVLEICERWDISGSAIGEVTATGRIRVMRGDELLGDMPVTALVDDVPLYDLSPERPPAPIYPPWPATLPEDSPLPRALLALLASPNIASRRPIFERYDSIVQSRTVRRPATADAAVLTIEPLGSHTRPAPAPAGRSGSAPVARSGSVSASGGSLGSQGQGAPLPGIAVSIDCNGRRVAADPYRGAVEAVLECASNLACVGAEPLGVTDNLNFGNPEKGHIAWQLTEAVRGVGDACRAIGAPIVGGNVSLYNESPAGPIYPTPVVGMVGALPDVSAACGLGFAEPGDAIALVGPFSPSLAASELAKLWGASLPDGLPELDLEAVVEAMCAVREAVRAGGIASAHDIAEGGLAVALAECCLAGRVGAEVTLAGLGGAGGGLGGAGGGLGGAAPGEGGAAPGEGGAVSREGIAAALFGEGPGGFLLSGPEEALLRVGSKTSDPPARAGGRAVPPAVRVQLIGRVGGDALKIECAGGETLEVGIEEMETAHGALGELFR